MWPYSSNSSRRATGFHWAFCQLFAGSPPNCRRRGKSAALWESAFSRTTPKLQRAKAGRTLGKAVQGAGACQRVVPGTNTHERGDGCNASRWPSMRTKRGGCKPVDLRPVVVSPGGGSRMGARRGSTVLGPTPDTVTVQGSAQPLWCRATSTNGIQRAACVQRRTESKVVP